MLLKIIYSITNFFSRLPGQEPGGGHHRLHEQPPVQRHAGRDLQGNLFLVFPILLTIPVAFSSLFPETSTKQFQNQHFASLSVILEVNPCGF